MAVKEGEFFFIKDDFFTLVDDENLKQDKTNTKRPHYFALKDVKTDNIIWAVPLSSKVDKYEKIVAKKEEKGRPRDGIQFAKVNGEKSVFLFQDMFPITKEYIKELYVIQGKITAIESKETVKNFRKIGKKVTALVTRGIKLVPNAVNIEKIQNILKEEIEEAQQKQKIPQKETPTEIIEKIDEKINNYKEGIQELQAVKKDIIKNAKEKTIDERTKEAKKEIQEKPKNIDVSKNKNKGTPEL